MRSYVCDRVQDSSLFEIMYSHKSRFLYIVEFFVSLFDHLVKISEIFIENFFSIFTSVSIKIKPCFLATILPKLDLPTPIIPNKTRFFLTVSRNIKFDFSQLCLIFQSK